MLLNSFLFLRRFSVSLKSLHNHFFRGFAHKSFLSRLSVLINYIMWSSNHFLYAAVSHIFQGPDFSRSRFFRVRVFQGPSFSGSSFFRVQVSQGLGCSGSSFFKVRVQGLGPGFRSSLKLRCWPLNFILHKAFL